MSNAARREDVEPFEPQRSNEFAGNTSEAEELIRLAATPAPTVAHAVEVVKPKRRWHAEVLGALLVLAMGYALFTFASVFGVGYERAHLQSRVQALAPTLDVASIAGLSGSESDSETPAFRALVAQLAHARSENPDCRFIYVMGLRHRQVVFLADGTDPTSPDYSQPGDVYDEATPDLVRSFTNGKPFVEGPTTDRWGTWVSGLVPMQDPATHQVVGVLGMDVNANRWRITEWIARILAALGTVLFAAATVLMLRRVRE